MELLFKESMSQKRKLQFLQPRGSEAKRETLSRLREMTHFELQNSAKAASLAENLLLGNLKRKTNGADRKPEPLAH